MNYYFRKIVGLLCVLTLLISPAISIPSFAVDNEPEDIVISEYEYITSIRAMSEEEIATTNLTDAEVQMIRSDAIEQEILSRKEKPDSELMARYGYTQEEIAILRAYSGENLEDNVELAAITGTLTITYPTVLTATTSRIGIQVIWVWDHCPVVCSIDVFAIYWDPTFGSSSGNMRISISDSSHVVKYNLHNTYFNHDWDITQVSPNSAAKSVFDMHDVSGEAWAERGTLNLYFDATAGSAALTEMDFIFAYGHTILSLSPSVSFPASGGISFGWTTDEADRRSGYINVSRKDWNDN